MTFRLLCLLLFKKCLRYTEKNCFDLWPHGRQLSDLFLALSMIRWMNAVFPFV